MITLFIIALLLCIYLISKNILFIIPLFICFLSGFNPSIQRTPRKKKKRHQDEQQREEPQEPEQIEDYTPTIINNPEEEEIKV